MESLFPKWMLKTFGILLIILIAIFILNQLNIMTGKPQTLNISAQGKVNATPDLAIVTIGVISEGVDPVDVKNKNNQKINQVIDFIKQQDIDKNDIQTTALYASPKYNYANGQNNIVGYQATQSITVKIHDIDKSQTKLEKILDGAVNNGANQIQGVNFSLNDPDKFKQAARKQAIQKAKEKAEELTDEAGLRLGKVINILETADSPNPHYPVAMNFAAREKSVAPDIQPGTQEISENITLVFEVY